MSIVLSLAVWVSCVNGREHEVRVSYVRVGFWPIAEVSLRHWLSVLRDFVPSPSRCFAA